MNHDCVWKFRGTTFIKMFTRFSVISCCKMALWFIERKVLGKGDNGELGTVFVKLLNREVYVRKFNVSDYGLLIDFFVSDVHERGGHYNFPQIDQRKDIEFILDGGGNIGFFSLLFAHKYPNSRIFSIEPEDSNFQILRKNCLDCDNITPINAGLWNKKTMLMIENLDSHSTGFIVKELDCNQVPDAMGISAIPIQYIQEVYGVPRFDFVKLDIEGAEFPIFEDDTCEEWLKNTKIVVMEIHDKYLDNGRNMIYARMKKNGFNHVSFNGDDLFENQSLES